jgi:hypothetical protein
MREKDSLVMDLSQRLTPVLESARTTAREVDATATFPEATVTALRNPACWD